MSDTFEELVIDIDSILEQTSSFRAHYAPYVPMQIESVEDRLCMERFGSMTIDEVEAVLRKVHPEKFI